MTTRERDRLRAVRDLEHSEARLYAINLRMLRVNVRGTFAFTALGFFCFFLRWAMGDFVAGVMAVVVCASCVAIVWAVYAAVVVTDRVRDGYWWWNPTGRS
jgi:hypothetical protein